jgi:Txe/YoeB family toxin of Txe-Axe toxin-antitoxin module
VNSTTDPSFWKCYFALPKDVRDVVWKNYQLWSKDPFHNSIKFKKILSDPSVWSARCGRNHRALGVMDEDTVIWFFVGVHDEYERVIKTLKK